MEDEIVEKYLIKPKQCLEELVLDEEDTTNKNLEELNAGIQQAEEEERKIENDAEIKEIKQDAEVPEEEENEHEIPYVPKKK